MSPLPTVSLLACCAAFALVGCGDNGDPLASASSRADISALTDGAAALGSATEFGVAQLYQGTTAIAGNGKATAFGTIALRDAASGGPGTPAAQSTSVDTAVMATASGGTAIGTFAFVSDQLAPDGSTLPANWWHAQLAFDGQTVPFAVTGDDTGIATATAGRLDLYVLDGATTVTSPGNWTQTLDVWTVATTASPLTVSVAAFSGGTYAATITGIRHLRRTVTRTDAPVSGVATATRTEAATVDGDAATLLAAVPTVGTLLGVVSGPVQLDSGSPGSPASFARSVHQTTVPGGALHTWEWRRNASWNVTQSKASADPSWTSTVVNGATQSYYVLRDAGSEGPYTALGLQNRPHWGQIIDLTKTGRRL